ncbi:MAG: glucosaminidase domain-containing protein [Saprospirales bacterium]|nr:glucosaminidase domain-containing protein [Saprospirales bacterium]
MKRLLVALHYQLIHFRPGGRRLPWFKIAIALLLVWMALKRDMQFQINLKNPGIESAALNGYLPVSQSVSATPVKGLGAELLGPKDPFADVAGDNDEDRRNKAYIRRFKDVAKTEMEKFGIPASVKMAQALIESQAGTSTLAKKNNNHFGIKCFSKSCKKGHCTNFSDDHHKDFFRIYSSAWESWRAHSYLLAKGKYQKLLNEGKDYKAWARGLKELGYATDPGYDKKVIDYIERYDLQVLDK